MVLNASVYVTEERENSYKARITLSQIQSSGMCPVQFSCTLTKGKHDLGVSFGNKPTDPDEDTRELFEHLMLYGAQKIVKTQVDIVREQCGRQVCTDTDAESSGIYLDSQVSGHIETELKEVPPYLQRLIDTQLFFKMK
ncbi:MAG: hypothetical protein V1836_04515 [Candidatus Aenigmatarchaeota archaeon]